MEPAELKKMNIVLADVIKVEAKEVCSSVSAPLSVMKVAVHLMFFHTIDLFLFLFSHHEKPDSSSLVGGPRRYAILCDKYTMRSTRIDPTISMPRSTGNAMKMRSSRLSVGEAAVRMATQSLDVEGGLPLWTR